MGRPKGSTNKNKSIKNNKIDKKSKNKNKSKKEKSYSYPEDMDENTPRRAEHIEKKRGRPKGWKKDPDKKSKKEIHNENIASGKVKRIQEGIEYSGDPEKYIKGNNKPEIENYRGQKYYVFSGYIGKEDKERITKNSDIINIQLYENKGKQDDWAETQWPPTKVKLKVTFTKDEE